MLVTAVRHAESLGNAGMLTEDNPDPLLSPHGLQQARLATERLASEGVTHIWSSPFRRAVRTASLLAEATGVAVLLEPEMVEHYIFEDLEGYPGRTGVDLKREFDCVCVPDGMNGPWTPAYPESWEQLLARTRRVAERALGLDNARLGEPAVAQDDVHLVVFGHGASTKGLVTALIGEAIARDAGFVNTGMSRARLDGTLPGETIFINDARHLAGLDNE